MLVVTLAALSVIAAIGPAAADPRFDAEIVTRSATQVSGADHVGATAPMLAHRLLPGTPAGPFLSLSGRLRGVEVHRFEFQWAESGTAYRGDSVPVGQPSKTVMPLPDGTIRLEATRAEAAVVLVADQLDADAGTQPWQILTVAKDPAVGLMNVYETYGAKPGPNETHGWFQEGTYISAAAGDFQGNLSGKVRLYWFQTTMSLRFGTQVQTLESRVWDDPAMNGAYVRHSVWHELWADAADVEIAPVKTDNVSSTLFAARLHLAGVETVSFDSADVVQGSLPPTAERVGPSLWMQGDMALDLDVPGSDEAHADLYRVQVQGLVQAYAVGGIAQMAAPAVGAISVLALLGGALFWIRDFVSEATARIWMVLHSKLRHERVLDHRLRDLVYRAIQAGPGIHFVALRKALRGAGSKVGSGTLLHHLDQLERFGLVRSRKAGRYRRFHATELAVAGANATRLAILDVGRARDVALAILAYPDMPVRGVHAWVRQRQEISVPGVRYLLRRLEREGLVESWQAESRRHYRATELLRVGLTQTPDVRIVAA